MEEECEPGSWISEVWDHPNLNWNHDCNPFITENFIVYSLISSDNSKMKMAKLSEEALDSLKSNFKFASHQEMGVSDRLDIYAKDYELTWGAKAYSKGIIMDAIDSRMFITRYEGDSSIYKAQIKHELTHIVQISYNSLQTIWFFEGLSEYMSSPVLGVPIKTSSGSPITNISLLITWRNNGHINPINIIDWNDFPNDDNYWEYYPMFRLAVSYLLDDKGLGKSLSDIKNMFTDMKGGIVFNETFENRMGIKIEYYRDHFYELMNNYLAQ